MADSTFDKSAFTQGKVSIIIQTLKAKEAFKGGDANEMIQATAKLLTSIVNEAIDESVKNASEAEKKYAKLAKKRFGFYVKGKLIVIDNIFKEIELSTYEINHTGSSMLEEGNDKLYPQIEKHEILYFLKNTFGLTVDALIVTTTRGVVSLLVSATDYILKNHLIEIDYNNISSNELKEKKYIVFNSEEYENILDDHWGKINQLMNNLNIDRVILVTDKSNSNAEVVFYKEYKIDTPNTFEIRGTYANDSKKDEILIPFLKRIDYPSGNKKAFLKIGKNSNDTHEIIVNYYSQSTSSSQIKSDLSNDSLKQAAAYALESLSGYVLDNHTTTSKYINLGLYSQKHIDDRINALEAIINNDKYGRYYYDQATVDLTNATSPMNFTRTVFVDTNYHYAPMYESEKDNTIVAKSRSNDFIVGGRGTDTIHGSDGDDEENQGNNPSMFSDDDTIYVGNDSDTLIGGKENDTLHSGNGIDKYILDSEEGFDTYIAFNKDIIIDNDGKDRITFEEQRLSGAKFEGESTICLDKGIYYRKDYGYDFISDNNKKF